MGYRDVDKYNLCKNDIIIIRMADPGKVAIVESNVDTIFSSYLIKIDYNEHEVKPYYMFYTLYSDGYQEHIKGFSNGTTSNSNISVIRNMLNKLIYQNQKLIKQRDLLLPRLINGTIKVM